MICLESPQTGGKYVLARDGQGSLAPKSCFATGNLSPLSGMGDRPGALHISWFFCDKCGYF